MLNNVLRSWCMTGFMATALFAGCNTPQNKTTETTTSPKAADKTYLSSWSDSTRSRIMTWMKGATDSGTATYIPVPDRIAVFDNDGTLWPEQPIPTQLVFAYSNLKALAPTHPAFQKDPVLGGVLKGDWEPLKKAGIKGVAKFMDASHNQQTEEAFNQAVKNWADTAVDKKYGKLYKEVVYLPMIELLDYLGDNGFKTFIVSGGGADFMRVWSEEVYGIPPYQVIGTYGQVKYEVKDGKPVITKVTGDAFIDDKTGKPEGIHRFIGKVPVFCAGNSDGDQAMLEYTSGSKYKSFGLIIHHTDDAREYAYDMKTLSGHLETALVEAKEKGWMVVDMKNDFKKVYAFQ